MNRLVSFLKEEEVEFETEKNLSHTASIGVGGVAPLFVTPKSKEKFTKTLRFIIKNNIPYFLTGNMTNLLPMDSGIDKVILSTLGLDLFTLSGNEITAESGALFSRIILFAADNHLGGYEKIFGIPGTVGGMLRVNAGAFGCSASDLLVGVEVYDPLSDKIIFLKKEEICFYYRDSDLKRRGLVILKAKFRLKKASRSDIVEGINEVKRKRRETQPIAMKTLGSVFKRTDIAPASYLIDKCGLKGYSIGGISVSEKHAGFFVNNGTGTAEDFLRLCDTVKFKVSEAYGVFLSEEFEYLS